jgi:hypothetical protein
VTTLARTQRVAAWPTLVGVQGLVVLSLAVVGWRFVSMAVPAPPPIEGRLQSLDVPRALAAVNWAVDQAESDSALMEEDVLRVTSFLALTADGAGLDVEDIRITKKTQSDLVGVDTVEAMVDVDGHVFDLPIFLAGIHRQRVVGRLQSLAFDVEPGGHMRGQARIHYHRPRVNDTAWVSERLALAAPGADAAAPVLERAAVLAGWKAFAHSNVARAETAMQARTRVARELPANLITLRKFGGRFVWDADEGIAMR